jgi:hypothetical protein
LAAAQATAPPPADADERSLQGSDEAQQERVRGRAGPRGLLAVLGMHGHCLRTRSCASGLGLGLDREAWV